MFRIIVEEIKEDGVATKRYEQVVETLDLTAVMAVVNKKKRIRVKKEKGE